MSQSLWDELQLEDKIFQILSVESHNPDHHFGRPFLTPYQIAISFKALFPDEFARISKPVGGKGTGQKDSLAQYFANELSQRINKGLITNIEGRFLHRKHLLTLQYDDEGKVIESSAMQAYDLSMYRRID
jgi:hypothetical protein